MTRSSKPTNSTEDTLPFEEALARLEAVVKELESGVLSLEASIERFEEGQQLVRLCGGLLEKAELRVKQLLGDAESGFVETDLESRGNVDGT